MNKTLIWVIVIVLVIAGGFVYFKKPAGPEQPLKIGVILPLSGEAAIFGEGVQRGIETARLNFPNNNNVEFIYADTAGIKNQSGITEFQRLTSVDKVDLIIGLFGTEQTLAVAPLIENYPEMLVFPMVNCGPQVLAYKQLFCIYPGVELQVESAAKQIKNLGLKKLYSLIWKAEIGERIGNALIANQSTGNYQVMATERVMQEEKDFRTLIAKMKIDNPDAVFSALTPDAWTVFTRQLHEQGYKGVHITNVDVTPEQIKPLGQAVEGVYFAGLTSPNYNPDFIAQYKAKYNSDPDLYAVIGQSVAQVVLGSLVENDYRLKGLAETVIDYRDAKTAFPNYHFNADRSVSIPLVVMQYKNGELVEVK